MRHRYCQAFLWRFFRRPAECDRFGRPRGASSAARLHWRCGEVQAGLEAAGRDGVGPVADLDVEPVPAAGQHMVGATVEGLERRHVAVSAYQERRGTQQVGWQLIRHVLTSYKICGR
jgi:hypothetical protein